MQISVKASDNFLADTEIHHADAAVSGERLIRTGCFQAESKLAGNRETRRLDFFDFIERQCRTDQFGGNILARKLIAEWSGDNVPAAADFSASTEHPRTSGVD